MTTTAAPPTKRQQVRERKITETEEMQFLSDFNDLAEQIDLLINEQPGAHDLDNLTHWFGQMQSLCATLAHYEARADALFNLSQFQAIANKEIPDADWQRIGRSSTLTTNYVAGLYWDRYVAWKRLHNLMNLTKTIFENTRTLIATVREEKKSQLQTVNNQNQPTR